MKHFTVLLVDYATTESVAEIPHIMSRAGASVTVFCSNRSWLLKNSYWNHYVPCNVAKAADYVACLVDHILSHHYDWVVLCDDPTIRIMNDYIEDGLLFDKIMPIRNIVNRSFLGSKAGLSELCHHYQIKTPDFIIYQDSLKDDDIINHVGFPLLLKIDHSSGGGGVFMCKSINETRKKISTLSVDEKYRLVIQKYIKGDNISVETLYRNGFLLAYAASRVLENLSGEFGVSFKRSYGVHPDLEPILMRIGECLELNGFGSGTFIRDANGDYYLVEMDMRPHAWFSRTKQIGVDFSVAAKNYLMSNLVMLQPAIANGQEVSVWHFWRDLRRLIATRDILGITDWLLNRDGRWRCVPCHDPVFLSALAGRGLRLIVKKIYGAWEKRFR